MAQVDFTNAVLDVYDNTKKPMTSSNYLGINGDVYFYNEQGSIINSNGAKSVILNTPAKVSILFTGSFTASGTSFHTDLSLWKVSNISFSSGDTYAFVIDIETSGNT